MRRATPLWPSRASDASSRVNCGNGSGDSVGATGVTLRCLRAYYLVLIFYFRSYNRRCDHSYESWRNSSIVKGGRGTVCRRVIPCVSEFKLKGYSYWSVRLYDNHYLFA